MSNYHFTTQEDAERYRDNNGGVVHDNRHSAHEYNDNQFTVHIHAEIGYNSVSGQTLRFTKERFEDWLQAKGWNERVKNMHRREFTGLIKFDSDGSFEHI